MVGYDCKLKILHWQPKLTFPFQIETLTFSGKLNYRETESIKQSFRCERSDSKEWTGHQWGTYLYTPKQCEQRVCISGVCAGAFDT